MNSNKKRISDEDRERASEMTREQKSRYFGPSVAKARLVARGQNRDYVAERAFKKTQYSFERYKNILRCPDVVFKAYGSGL